MSTCAATDCKRTFTPRKGGRPQKYCSKGCKNRERQRLYRVTHLEKLRSAARRRYAANPGRVLKSNRRWREANPEKVRRRNLWKNYGYTPEMWYALFETQNRCCALFDSCGSTTPGWAGDWHMDHEHVDGFEEMPPEEKRKYVRGILCHHCNLMLGHAGDSPKRLQAGAKYLAENRAIVLVEAT